MTITTGGTAVGSNRVIDAAMTTLDGVAAPLIPLQTFSGDFLYLALLFVVLAIIAAVFGARGIAGMSMTIAKWLVIIFLVLAVVSIIL